LSAPDRFINSLSPPLIARVELIADIGCPWSYIGFHRLRRLQRESTLRLVWRPFLLNPHLPPEGIERRAYRVRRFGNASAAQRLDRKLIEIGRSEGIAFAFERMSLASPTAAAHGLLLEAQARGLTEQAAELLFAAAFEEGRDLGDPDLLERVAGQLGLHWNWPARTAAIPHGAEVMQSHHAATAAGVTGVPTFLFAGAFSIAGAQPLEALRALNELALLAGSSDPGANALSPADQSLARP
jgi:predicted DsbA family dithiol-disulfide isomerase